jgi:hypothetical protein
MAYASSVARVLTESEIVYWCPRCERRLPVLEPCEHITIAPEGLQVLRKHFAALLVEHEMGARNVSGVPVLPTDRELLDAAGARIVKLEGLLARCEPFLPQNMTALVHDVRDALGIDDRGFRVVVSR